MARRSSNKNNDNMGCMFAGVDLVMSLLLILFTSENPTARKVGWGIVIGALFLNALGREGASAEDIEVVFILGIIIIVVVCLFKAFTKPTEKNIDHKPTGNAKSYEKPLESEESVGFEESFRRIVQQERKVTGEKIKKESLQKEQKVEAVSAFTSILKQKVRQMDVEYYHSVAEALQKHSVPSGYRKIMIECIQRTDIRECPGLMWKDCEMLYILPLIKDSRIYNWPLVSVPIILYEKRISPDIDSEYMNVGMSDISAEFEELFPEYPYGKDGVYTGKFILPVGIEVTNTSGKALFDMIPVEFHVVDNITQSACYVEEIKQLYQKYILRENHIISYEEYAKEREKLLHKYKMREKNDEKYQEQIESAGKLKLL